MEEGHIIVLVVKKIMNKNYKLDSLITDITEILNRGISEEIKSMLRNKHIVSIVIDNDLFFKNIVSLVNVSPFNLIEILRLICKVDKNYFIQNRYKLLYYFDSEIFYKLYFAFCDTLGINVEDLVCYLDRNNIKVEYENLLEVILNTSSKNNILSNHLKYFYNSNNLIQVKDKLLEYDVSKNIVDKINEKIDNDFDIVLEKMVSGKLDVEKLKQEDMFPFFKQIIDELLCNENLSYHEIKFLGAGYTSLVYEIGSKILKLGVPRKTFELKNNKRFLKPLYRKNIYDKNNENILFCIEITERVATDNITVDDVYMLYKELRDEGLYWLDCSTWNTGRLIKDNKIYFNDIDTVNHNSTSYSNDEVEILKKGELVIIDNDYIFNEDEYKTVKDDYLDLMFELFEERYQKEKINSIKK